MCTAGTPAPMRAAAGLTPGTAEEEPKPFSEWIEEGFPGVPPPGDAPLEALSPLAWPLAPVPLALVPPPPLAPPA